MNSKIANPNANPVIPIPVPNPVAATPNSGATPGTPGAPAASGEPGAAPAASASGDPATPGAGTPALPGAATPAAPAQPTFDPNAWLETQSGGKYKSWEAIQADLNKAPERVEVPVQPTFTNDASKAVYEAIVAGKEDDVLPILQARVFARNVATMQPEEIIKTKLKVEYPSLDASDIEAEFASRYQPDQLQLDAVQYAREQKKATDRLKKDAAEAITYFTSAVPEIKLPQVAQPAAAQPAPVQLSPDAQLAVALGETFGSDKVSTVPFEFAVPNTPIKVKGQTALPVEEITQLQSKIEKHPAEFLAGVISRRWGTASGTFNVEAIARDIIALENQQLMANKVAEQTYNQVIIEKLKIDKNYQQGATPSASGGFQNVGEEAEGALQRLFRIPAEKAAV